MELFIQLLFTLLCCNFALAKNVTSDPVQKGLEISKAMDAIDNGFKDQKANMQMILRDQRGQEASRDIIVETLEVPGDGDKSLITFNQPRTVKGTKFLTFTHKKADDDQWLFLPKLKRVKRISSSNKNGSFMGSEFAYEDISSQEVEKYKYKYIKDEKMGSTDCFVIERIPTNKDSGYSKQVVWIAKGEGQLRPLQIQYYDKKDAHFKTLKLEGYKQYEGRYWRAGVMKMVNHATGKSTDLVWKGYQFKTGVSGRDFDSNALKR